MIVQTLDLQNFRNIEAAHLEFSPGFNVIYGANAQGKSNLLEALYVLAFLKGFRADKIANLIRFDQPNAALSAYVADGNTGFRLGVALQGKSRRLFVNNTLCAKMNEYLGLLRAILFIPAHVSILQSAPETRRNLLDRMVFTLHPSYLIDLVHYQKITKQKSSMLKSECPDKRLLDVYDEQMTATGERLIRARYDYLRRLQPFLWRAFSEIFGENRHCTLKYVSATMPREIACDSASSVDTADAIVESFRMHVAKSRALELQKMQICSGPHRDDWTIDLDGQPARHFASQGQQRALSIAMKIAEILCLKSETQVEPILLLDDISSEFDPTRHRNLFRYLNRLTGQIFLTTTSKSLVHIDDIGKLFKIDQGIIENDAISTDDDCR